MPKKITTKKNNRTTIIVLGIFFLAMLLRVLLASVNRQANDNHLEVIGMIQFKGIIPHLEDCWQGYQPKLYHQFCAIIGQAFNLRTFSSAVVSYQMINVIAGFFTLVMGWKLLKQLNLRDDVRIISFLLIALNPCLIGINAQVTNDSFVILFGSIVIYCLWKYIQTQEKIYIVSMIFANILTCLSKGSGLFIFAGSVLTLLICFFSSWSDRVKQFKFAISFIILVLSFVLIVPWMSEYYHNWKKFGDPFKLNVPKSVPPKFFEVVPDNSFRNCPGVTSLWDSWFSLRLIDLIENPYITGEKPPIPYHRTSLWTQLYARTHFIHFDQHPPSWKCTSTFILTIGRCILALSVFHLLLTLVGLVKNIGNVCISIYKQKAGYFLSQTDWMFLLFFGIFIAMILKMTYDYRNFFTMKSIYLFPIILTFLKFFADGCDWLIRKADSKRFNHIVYGWCAAVLGLYITDMLHLFFQLMP
jgi:hypothetical protein